ncbi:MAG TPA: hypothetical protein VJS14_00620 [Enterobacteriaceae bacterium]|nr:hypothetical protein [Enterobacteriaceae bacterium]
MRHAQLTRRPGLDFALLREVWRKHAPAFVLLLGLGALFLLVSLVLFFRVWLSDAHHGIALLIFLLVFGSCGLFIVGFACVSNFSSMRHYYEKGLLRQHGLNITAVITEKNREECVAELRDESRRINVDELLLTVGFRFQFAGEEREGADILTSEALFNALEVGQTIPVRILPWLPESGSIRQRALSNQLKRTQSIPEEDNNSRTGEPLIDNERT